MNEGCMPGSSRAARGGFTLIELLVVVLIIGILAAIAIPEYFKVVEKSRAAEATSTFDTIRGSEERYDAQAGNYYTGSLTSNCLLDVCTNSGGAYPTLSNFTPGSIITSGSGWSLTLTRIGAPTGFGNYTLTYTAGGGAQSSLIANSPTDPNPCIDLGLGSTPGNNVNCF